MSRTWQHGAAVERNVNNARHSGNAYVAAQDTTKAWLYTKVGELKTGIDQVPWPTLSAWRQLSSGYHAPLPASEIVCSNLSRQYRGASRERLLRIFLGQVVDDLMGGMLRVRFDPKGELIPIVATPSLSAIVSWPAEHPNLPVPAMQFFEFDETAQGKRGRFIGKATIGIAHLHSTPEVQAYPMTFVPNSQSAWRTAAHLLIAEQARGEGMVFRTPDAALGKPTVDVWRDFEKAGLAHALAAFTPLPNREEFFTGHICMGPADMLDASGKLSTDVVAQNNPESA